MAPRGFLRRTTAALGLLGLIAILHTAFQSILQRRASPSFLPLPKPTVVPFPPEYDISLPAQSDYCAERFSVQYLEDLRDNAAKYCPPGSRSSFTCFHSHVAEHGQADSMCVGRGARMDSSGEFTLDCSVRDLSPEEVARGLVPFAKIRNYWYDTGPARVISEAVRFLPGGAGADRGVEVEGQRRSVAAVEAGDGAGTGVAPRFYILLKREGFANTWHSLMEIWSSWLSIDVLRMASRTPLDSSDEAGAPFFYSPNDVADTQVVILDNSPDGPYFDLWTLFAGRRPIRLHELMASEHPRPAALSDIIIPLTGASNPLWQNDWEPRDCTTGATLATFVQRILGFYGIPDDGPSRDPAKGITVTFIDRRSNRVLINQEALLATLRDRVPPQVSIRLVDFASVSFAEQIRIARETDVLVGVHGAGLTHTMFMTPGSGAVVEIQPVGLDHVGFRNLAAMRQLGYFHARADEPAPKDDDAAKAGRGMSGGTKSSKRSNWQSGNVTIEAEPFLKAIELAIKSLFPEEPRKDGII
ncbi:related to DUF563 domain protein [Cephalotrichum gorgonifer]|uniref:EGF domain-specific O-linked N-acetylglucosamine transferase n=1 Tax=Cephalotrichum gorgonifer TaxID=2041049 RepID=A0AAE8MVU6_9PEZI|nr:related to DUF563 domain protein [Cephalotrichum gorgonifer]